MASMSLSRCQQALASTVQERRVLAPACSAVSGSAAAPINVNAAPAFANAAPVVSNVLLSHFSGRRERMSEILPHSAGCTRCRRPTRTRVF